MLEENWGSEQLQGGHGAVPGKSGSSTLAFPGLRQYLSLSERRQTASLPRVSGWGACCGRASTILVLRTPELPSGSTWGFPHWGSRRLCSTRWRSSSWQPRDLKITGFTALSLPRESLPPGLGWAMEPASWKEQSSSGKGEAQGAVWLQIPSPPPLLLIAASGSSSLKSG